MNSLILLQEGYTSHQLPSATLSYLRMWTARAPREPTEHLSPISPHAACVRGHSGTRRRHSSQHRLSEKAWEEFEVQQRKKKNLMWQLLIPPGKKKTTTTIFGPN